MIFQNLRKKYFKIDVFDAEKLEKNNGEKIFELCQTSLKLFIFLKSELYSHYK